MNKKLLCIMRIRNLHLTLLSLSAILGSLSCTSTGQVRPSSDVACMERQALQGSTSLFTGRLSKSTQASEKKRTVRHGTAYVADTFVGHQVTAREAEEESKRQVFSHSPRARASNFQDRHDNTSAHPVAGASRVPATSTERDIRSYTPTHRAAECGDVEALVALIQSNANLNTKDNAGHTPIHLAARSGHVEVIKMLHRAVVDLNA